MADTLIFNTIKDRYSDSSYYYGAGISNQNGLKQYTKGFATGSTSMQASNSGQKKAQDTNATIGQGVIVTGSDVSGLNRDIALSQKITKDKKSGGLSIDLTIDNQAFLNPGNYFAPLSRLGENLPQAGQNLKQAGINFTETVSAHLSGKGKDGLLDDYHGKIRNQEMALQAKRNPNAASAIANLPKDMKNAEQTLEALATEAVKSDGIKENVDIVFYNALDGYEGGHKDGKIYINLAYQDGDIQNMLTVLGDELSHYVDYKKGRTSSQTREDISTGYGKNATSQTSVYLGNKVSEGDYSAFQAGLANYDFSQNNSVAATIDPNERLTRGIDIELGRAFGVGVSGKIGIVWDDEGNIGFRESEGGGLSTPGLFLGVKYSESNADNIDMLRGASTDFSSSFAIGAAYIGGGTSYCFPIDKKNGEKVKVEESSWGSGLGMKGPILGAALGISHTKITTLESNSILSRFIKKGLDVSRLGFKKKTEK